MGSLRLSAIFEDDRIAGAWRWYRENGLLMQTGEFDGEEKKHGIWRRYHPNGKLMDEGRFEHGRKTGAWTLRRGRQIEGDEGFHMTDKSGPQPIVLGPDEGRCYEMGRLRAVFKADGAETGDRYAVSEWLMEPGFDGVGAHSHEANDEIFFVSAGAPELLVGEDWREVEAGAFLRIPAGIMHDFRNLSDKPAALLNVFIPGGFESMMPKIVEWFANNPPKD